MVEAGVESGIDSRGRRGARQGEAGVVVVSKRDVRAKDKTGGQRRKCDHGCMSAWFVLYEG